MQGKHTDSYNDASAYLKTSETAYARESTRLYTEVKKYEVKVEDFEEGARENIDDYTVLIRTQDQKRSEYYQFRNETEKIQKTFNMLYESFTILTDQLKSISKTTGL